MIQVEEYLSKNELSLAAWFLAHLLILFVVLVKLAIWAALSLTAHYHGEKGHYATISVYINCMADDGT